MTQRCSIPVQLPVTKKNRGHIDNRVGRFRSAKPAPGYEKVLIPRDVEREMELVRSQEGIPLFNSVAEDLAAKQNGSGDVINNNTGAAGSI